ncbi:MAG: hypothetical protein ACE5FC_09400 [Myxococcota bacterium]
MELFHLIAECSVAFAGFAAIYAGVRGSGGARGSFRAWSTVTAGFLSFLLSLVPLLLQKFAVEEPAIWRISSSIGLVALSGMWCAHLIVHRRLSSLGHPVQSTLAIYYGLLSPPVAALALLANAVGWPRQSGPFLYGLAVILILFSGVAAFLLTFWLPLRNYWGQSAGPDDAAQ